MSAASKSALNKDRVSCRTPTPGKRPTSIPAWKYRLVRQALLAIVPAASPGIAAKDLPARVAAVLAHAERERLGSVSWHVTTVRLEMEVAGELQRVVGAKPLHVVRRVTGSEVVVRPVAAADHAQWLTLRRALFDDLDDAFHAAEMAIYASADDKACLLAELRGRCVGFVELSLRNVVDGCLSSPVGYLEGIFVMPEARGLGVSRSLIEHAAAWFEQQGCREMATDALVDDRCAQDYHRHLGFVETYRIVEFRQPLVNASRQDRNEEKG